MEIQIRLPSPHQLQAEIKSSPAKRRVVVLGRRSGKTTLFTILAVEAMLAGRRVLELAPTADQTGAFWTGCRHALAAPIAAGLVRKNETERTLELLAKGGGRIRAKTAWDANTARGDYADLLLLDEYSIMKGEVWDEVGAPMLLDNDGDAVFAFTPKRKNHAFHLYAQALGNDSGRWAAWQMPSMCNPYLSTAALEEISGDMTAEAYRQEIMAEFLDNEGAVFHNIAACLGATATDPKEHAGHKVVLGIDWGKQRDFTVLSLGCPTCKREVARARFNQIDYIAQRDRVKQMFEQWRPAVVLAESNAMGEPIIDQLHHDGVPVRGFATTAQSKPPLIENLALALERGEWQFFDDRVWTAELEAYERKVSATTGRATYSAPEGVHDDTVMARALMLRAAQQGRGVYLG